MAIFEFPEYSDLGGISAAQRDTWEGEKELRAKYRHYYSGDIFNEKVPLEAGIDSTDIPPLYPVGLNLVKMLCIAQAEALFGEWDEEIVRFCIRQDSAEDPVAAGAIELASTILQSNNFNAQGYEISLDRELYGGAAIKIGPELSLPGYIRLGRVNLDNFYPVWDPDRPEVLLECWIKTVMTKEQVKAKYGISTDKEIVERVEYWNPRRYENRVDDKRIDAYSGVNPWNVVPIVYIPRLRSNAWWGDALTPDLMAVQDELNMRVADLGESLNYNSHPTRWGVNMPHKFNVTNFEIGPGAMWDLGKAIGAQSPLPQVGILEIKNPIPERALDFLKFLYDWSTTSSFIPPIAFGKDDGGGQRSGRTLEIRMWPLIRTTRRSRAYMAAGFQRMLYIIGLILQQKKIAGVQHSSLRFLDGSIVPSFWPMMPKDQAAIVDQVVKLMSIEPVPAVSLATAHKWLGLGPAEQTRIEDFVASGTYDRLLERQNPKPVTPATSKTSGDE